MYILGLNAYHADSSAAIFKDGVLLAATEEERFTRTKHWAGFPKESILFCLREAGITLKEVDYITIGRDPNAKIFNKLIYLLKNPQGGLGTAINRLKNSKKVLSLEREFALISDVSEADIAGKIRQIEHHRSHLASAFFASPFDEAALLSIDGSGDFTSTMIAIGRGNKIEVLDSVDFPVSIGTFYTCFTQYLGFPHYGDEYKVMGLAPYGKPLYVDKLKDVIHTLPNGLFTWNSKYFKSAKDVIVRYNDDHVPVVESLFSPYLENKFGPARKQGEELSQYYIDVAASVQRFTEELIFSICNHLQQRTGLKNLCIAGGVAQNSVANGKIIAKTNFDRLYIPSAGHDAGISMGSCLYLYNQELNYPRAKPIYNAHTGSKFDNDEIEKILIERNIKYTKLSDVELYDKVADGIINGGVIGWFQGRAEFGPRALGGRSIIADPRRADAKELLNAKIKRRESFRPFAPSILKEYVSEYFELVGDVPFMEKVFPIKKDQQNKIPAVTHVDGTGRLQTVDKEVSSRYYHLIDTFRQKTGVPILLNTSFNENEPIVNTPTEALNCFLRTRMDMLVLENIIVERD